MATELIEIDVGRELVLERAGSLPGERVALAAAQGRALAEGIRSAERVPGFDNSAMDGFAVRAGDLAGVSADRPATLAISDESRAGTEAEARVTRGTAIAISTGAVLPLGADAVVRVEDTERDGASVCVRVAPDPGANVRRAGDDIEPGDELLPAGARLGPAELGVLASVGAAEPRCTRVPRVSLVSTGDELIGVEDELRLGSVRNSNAYALPALIRETGSEPVGVARAPDDHAATVTTLASGLEADVLVITGGVSVGEHDHVKAALAELGVEQIFWGVSLKPGKPAYFGVGPAGTLVFGLPGNPVSAYVTFLLFARPALLALQGLDPAATRVEARLAAAYEKPADRAHAIRCRLELTGDGWLAHPAPHQGSHVMTSLLGADGLALIPAATARVEAGAPTLVELLP